MAEAEAVKQADKKVAKTSAISPLSPLTLPMRATMTTRFMPSRTLTRKIRADILSGSLLPMSPPM